MIRFTNDFLFVLFVFSLTTAVFRVHPRLSSRLDSDVHSPPSFCVGTMHFECLFLCRTHTNQAAHTCNEFWYGY